MRGTSVTNSTFITNLLRASLLPSKIGIPAAGPTKWIHHPLLGAILRQTRLPDRRQGRTVPLSLSHNLIFFFRTKHVTKQNSVFHH
jgi:hypothetical protein